MAKKKSYNPFKMWGSYAGALLGWMTLWFGNNEYFNFWYLKIWQTMLHLPSIKVQAILLVAIIGFLLGWGIHSLVRKMRK